MTRTFNYGIHCPGHFTVEFSVQKISLCNSLSRIFNYGIQCPGNLWNLVSRIFHCGTECSGYLIMELLSRTFHWCLGLLMSCPWGETRGHNSQGLWVCVGLGSGCGIGIWVCVGLGSGTGLWLCEIGLWACGIGLWVWDWTLGVWDCALCL